MVAPCIQVLEQVIQAGCSKAEDGTSQMNKQRHPRHILDNVARVANDWLHLNPLKVGRVYLSSDLSCPVLNRIVQIINDGFEVLDFIDVRVLLETFFSSGKAHDEVNLFVHGMRNLLHHRHETLSILHLLYVDKRVRNDLQGIVEVLLQAFK